jgi:integrase
MWDEIDMGQRLWVIPKERNKQGREHRVPLSDRVVELLLRQQEYNGNSPYVFPDRYGEKPTGSKSPLWILQSIDPNVTMHGFRSTFRDWAGDCTHHPRNLIEECMAHVVGEQSEQAYRRSDALEKRRDIMNEWAAFCAGREAAATSKAEE